MIQALATGLLEISAAAFFVVMASRIRIDRSAVTVVVRRTDHDEVSMVGATITVQDAELAMVELLVSNGIRPGALPEVRRRASSKGIICHANMEAAHEILSRSRDVRVLDGEIGAMSRKLYCQDPHSAIIAAHIMCRKIGVERLYA